MIRSAHVRTISTAVLAISLGIAATPAGQTGQAQQRVFRAGTQFVQVDAYPRSDGRIVEGLTAKDFQVLEDGVPQTIESVEFIRADMNTPEAERFDPNTQREGNEQAADPRRRVFLIYFDHYHASLYGSHQLQRPTVDMLNRMLAPQDLFATATVLTRPMDVIFGRRTITLERQLEEHWTWGLKTDKSIDFELDEQIIERCYGEEPAAWYARRMREDKTLQTLTNLTNYLGGIREARKVIVLFSRGWPMARPDRSMPEKTIDLDTARTPRVGVTNGGRLSTDATGVRGVADWAKCNSELSRAAELDNRRTFFDLITAANRNNVTFYGVNTQGLSSNEVLRTISNGTDGFAVETNDFSAGLRRIADDVSAYYVLGYYTNNSKFDGRYRKIDVRMNRPGIEVKARRGYTSPLPERAGAAAPAARDESADALALALGYLSRLKSAAELYTHAAVGAETLVVAELGSRLLAGGDWAQGAQVQVTVTDPSGTTVRSQVRIPPGQRGALVRLPKSIGAGPHRITVRVVSPGAESLTDTFDAPVPTTDALAQPLLFRGGPGAQSALRPVADFQYRRTERAHIEWVLNGAADKREARLLSQKGQPLAVPVALTEREQNGTRVLAADLNLAPLAPGDYVIEVSVTAGERTTRRFVAIRVTQ